MEVILILMAGIVVMAWLVTKISPTKHANEDKRISNFLRQSKALTRRRR